LHKFHILTSCITLLSFVT